jgi:hypothetical protein
MSKVLFGYSYSIVVEENSEGLIWGDFDLLGI